tara:strand:+ start:532 stop:999 length:468 start_codon:yes stop_codon:yes gene_type:complete
MQIHLVAIGNKMPPWVDDGFDTYAKRLPAKLFKLLEVPPAKRTARYNVDLARKREGQAILAALPQSVKLVALDQGGQTWSTNDLVVHLSDWMLEGIDIALIIGGADGLSETCLAKCEKRWSLSAHTLPHGLARIMVSEQIYRAWSVLNNHPYHRA